ncbi:MAG: DUF3391 domain-containing protein [Betaproteobacteria bacterium]|nr:DUF3391 domain-containing protein [Betaproteobacteria bacterium]
MAVVKRRLWVEELRLGMYVVELDRPWTDTRFPLQGFVLSTKAQLDILRDLCKEVYIDVERSSSLPSLGGVGRSDTDVRGGVVHAESETLETEMPLAADLYAECLRLFDGWIQSIENNQVLEAPKLREAVARLTTSVLRNPNALMLVSRLHEKGSAMLARALDVSIYMIVFGRFLQLPRDDLELLGLTGLLQDVGKTRLPNEVLNKRGRLTREEVEIAKSHVKHSVEIVGSTEGLSFKLAELVSLHHERQDGAGYPRGLKGSEIGLHGSIAAIVDSFDALTSARPYAPQLSPSDALGLLHKARGTKFHGALVEQFIQCIGAFPVGSLVELNTGEVGIVIAQNLVRRLTPRVMVVLQADGNPKQPHLILDLAREPKSAEGETYRIRRTLEHGKVRIDPREFFI